jgi:ureidoacrylate peracid hydrolase
MDFRFLGEPAPGPRGEAGRHFVDGSWSTEIIPELAPAASDIVITKTRFSGFWGTNLDAVLRQLGVRTLVVAGEATSVCVESTVRDAVFLDYNCVTLTDCTAELFGREAHEAALWRLGTLFGWTCTSTELSEALRQGVPEAIPAHV